MGSGADRKSYLHRTLAALVLGHKAGADRHKLPLHTSEQAQAPLQVLHFLWAVSLAPPATQDKIGWSADLSVKHHSSVTALLPQRTGLQLPRRGGKGQWQRHAAPRRDAAAALAASLSGQPLLATIGANLCGMSQMEGLADHASAQRGLACVQS
jgi:hypothetical protein